MTIPLKDNEELATSSVDQYANEELESFLSGLDEKILIESNIDRELAYHHFFAKEIQRLKEDNGEAKAKLAFLKKSFENEKWITELLNQLDMRSKTEEVFSG